MGKSLKEKNQPQLIAFVLVNAVGLGIVLQGLKQVFFLLQSPRRVISLCLGGLSSSRPHRY